MSNSVAVCLIISENVLMDEACRLSGLWIRTFPSVSQSVLQIDRIRTDRITDHANIMSYARLEQLFCSMWGIDAAVSGIVSLHCIFRNLTYLCRGAAYIILL